MTSALWLALGIAAVSALAMLLLPKSPQPTLQAAPVAPRPDRARPDGRRLPMPPRRPATDSHANAPGHDRVAEPVTA
jgi:hypothetical protein